MTDRELLRYAAKAAGITTETDGDAVFFYNEFNDVWSPLDDDGDALRLAVKLRADISIGQSVKVTLTRLVNGVDDTQGAYFGRAVISGKNDEEAVRRAIVRAAAEIGKEMQAAT